jgi:hypothetical protein
MISGIWWTSVWIPIIQISVGVIAGGNLHNLSEEQNKTEMPEESAESENDLETEEDLPEYDSLEQRRFKTAIISAAREHDIKKVFELSQDPENQKYFARFSRQLNKEANNGSAEAIYVGGFLIYAKAQLEGNANNVRAAIANLGPAIALIAQAAQKNYRPAMKIIAHNYRQYHYGNCGKAEKELFKAVLTLASEFCSPEYCDRNCM